MANQKISGKISAANKIFLLQNLYIMIKTGVSLADALKTLSEQTKNKKLKSILTDLKQKISEGKSFGESLELYQENLGDLFVNMIKAGEASGSLESVLKELFNQTKKEHTLTMKVKNAMTYPTIIVVAMTGIVTFLVVFVLPSITVMFKDLNAELPLVTKLLIAFSDFAQKNIILIGIIFISILFAFFKFIKTTKGKFIFDNFLLKIPILNEIIKKVNLARIARSLSSLIKTDIAIVESIVITSKIVGNSIYRKTLTEASEKIKKGEKLATIFGQYPQIFPTIIVQMIDIGEETGAIDEILENLANYYEEEVFQTMDSLPTIIEPLLMLLIGAGVAFIAVAILLPMFSLTQSL